MTLVVLDISGKAGVQDLPIRCIITIMKLGFIGLGKMGSRMAGKLLQEGHEIVVWNRSEEGISNFKNNDVILASDKGARPGSQQNQKEHLKTIGAEN